MYITVRYIEDVLYVLYCMFVNKTQYTDKSEGIMKYQYYFVCDVNGFTNCFTDYKVNIEHFPLLHSLIFDSHKIVYPENKRKDLTGYSISIQGIG